MPGDNLRDLLLEFMRSRGYQPMTKSELARSLAVPSERRTDLRLLLGALMAEGLVAEGRKSRYELRVRSAKHLVGTLKFHPKGHAFFFPDPTDAQNLATGLDLAALSRIQIPRREAATALDGDRVLVSLRTPRPRADARRRFRDEAPLDEASGKVEKVLTRRSGRLVGIFHQQGRHASVTCDDKALDGDIEIIGETTAQNGQLVVVDLAQWTERTAAPRGRIIEVLGWPGDAGVDMIAVIHRFGLRTAFPEAVLAAARATPEAPEPAEIARRKDWRNKLVITIDPADAKDHDDAIWLEKTSRGWTLAVHIADVSHYVKPGSALDREAAERGNSTYLVDRVLPMLPTELSNGICSLVPNVDRLTKCALLDIAPDGEVKKARFIDAVIHSRAKLSYEQAQAIIDGKPAPAGSDPALAETIREGWRLAGVLRQRRFKLGALDLEMPEIRVRLDDQGRPIAVDPVVHTASHQLVEECMLAANDAVARVLRERQKPAIHRIHEDPDPSRLLDYTATAKLYGYNPGDLTNRAHIQKLLDDSKGSPEEHVIKLGLLKSLKRAAYSAESLGHYGLAKGDYCHFTSPIRRYADLIVHRALQPLLDNPPKPADRTPSFAEMRDISRHISDTERVSAEAEGETKQLKLLEYLRSVAGAADPPVFDGLISEARPMGLMVEIPALGVRGVVKREDLPEGRWRFEAHRMAWVSFDGRIVQSGMRVPLRVKAIDAERRFVDFTLAGKPTTEVRLMPARRPSPVAKKHDKPKPAATAGPPQHRKTQPSRKPKHRRRK